MGHLNLHIPLTVLLYGDNWGDVDSVPTGWHQATEDGVPIPNEWEPDASNEFIENNAYIYSFFGRKRRLPESKSTNAGVAKHSVRSGVNFLVQSVASDINLLGVIDAMEWIKENKYQKEIIPFTVVHDSIVAEVKNELVDEWVVNSKKCIQIDRGISIPGRPIGVDFEIGPSWGELENYE